MPDLSGPLAMDAQTFIATLNGSSEKDTLVTVLSISGAGTLTWKASRNLHIRGFVCSSANAILGVVGIVSISQPQIAIGLRQVSSGCYSGIGATRSNAFPMNIAVLKDENILFNATVACVGEVLFSFD